MRAFTAAQAAAFRLDGQHLSDRSAQAFALRSGDRGAQRASIVDVCRDSGGIQAQVMSAAELSIWTRRQQTTRAGIQDALWTRRDLVKTSAMRLTLHLIPARDFAIYIAALKPMSMAILQRWHARVGAGPGEVRPTNPRAGRFRSTSSCSDAPLRHCVMPSRGKRTR